jgi:methylmalonyl-CoA/ethylmalonyl-CoA epimerase
LKANSIELAFLFCNMEHIEHLGIAVKDLEASILMYEVLLNTKCYKREEVKSENVITAFFQSGPNKVELLQATSEDSAIHKFIEKKGEGIHHVAFSVKNIRMEMERLSKDGFRLLNEQPKRGADNKLICFVHPKDTSGVLMELCQEISE